MHDEEDDRGRARPSSVISLTPRRRSTDVDAHLVDVDAGACRRASGGPARLHVGRLGPTWTRIRSPPAPRQRLDLGVVARCRRARGRASASSVTLVVGRWDLPRHAALEVDAEVQAPGEQRQQADEDEHAGDGEADPALADEVEVGLAVVQAVPARCPCAGVGLPARRPDGRRGRSSRCPHERLLVGADRLAVVHAEHVGVPAERACCGSAGSPPAA